MSENSPTLGTITLLLERANAGDVDARNAVLEMAYPELREIARRELGRRLPRGGIDSTEMVGMVCERLLRQYAIRATDRRHFYNLFACVLRGVLMDFIRAARADKRGGQFARVPLDDIDVTKSFEPDPYLDLHEAMTELQHHDPAAYEIVNLRSFCGRTLEECAEITGYTLAGVRAHWDYGISWLGTRMSGTHGNTSPAT